ncbi:hypothetical protein GCM10010909_31550 [Acidocella aquatica]|uniref:Uncharacterized protein n=1 Tax=Acidocella aquatica TaxID=1922313 RepID=A0ABQ6AEC9_9PROT|nr:DUF6502 family protein [Acidocella aquatica]GLR68474.1 hypothetical protein GCM10010909_31550 [Acidocella aquatica]
MEADVETMVRRLLSPLIVYLMRRGVGYIALRDLLKKIYVEEALGRHTAEEAPTDSTISLVTGINRREVKRLRDDALQARKSEVRDPMAGVNMAARVVATWVSAPVFLDAHGEPRHLGTRGSDAEPNFDSLLRAAKVDVRARTVIEELNRAGIVERDDEDHLYLLRAAFTPGTPKDKMLFLAANVSDHLRSALHNLAPDEPPFIERALFHNGISARQLEAVRPALSTMADRMLRRANEKLLESSADSPAADAGLPLKRLRLGVYYYETSAEDQP